MNAEHYRQQKNRDETKQTRWKENKKMILSQNYVSLHFREHNTTQLISQDLLVVVFLSSNKQQDQRNTIKHKIHLSNRNKGKRTTMVFAQAGQDNQGQVGGQPTPAVSRDIKRLFSFIPSWRLRCVPFRFCRRWCIPDAFFLRTRLFVFRMRCVNRICFANFPSLRGGGSEPPWFWPSAWIWTLSVRIIPCGFGTMSSPTWKSIAFWLVFATVVRFRSVWSSWCTCNAVSAKSTRMVFPSTRGREAGRPITPFAGSWERSDVWSPTHSCWWWIYSRRPSSIPPWRITSSTFGPKRTQPTRPTSGDFPSRACTCPLRIWQSRWCAETPTSQCSTELHSATCITLPWTWSRWCTEKTFWWRQRFWSITLVLTSTGRPRHRNSPGSDGVALATMLLLPTTTAAAAATTTAIALLEEDTLGVRAETDWERIREEPSKSEHTHTHDSTNSNSIISKAGTQQECDGMCQFCENHTRIRQLFCECLLACAHTVRE